MRILRLPPKGAPARVLIFLLLAAVNTGLVAEPRITVNAANTQWGVVALSPNDRFIAALQGREVALFDYQSARRLRSIPAGDIEATALHFTADEQTILVGMQPGVLGLADVETGEYRWSVEMAEPQLLHSIDIAPNGSVALVGGWLADEEAETRGRTMLVDMESGEVLWTVEVGSLRVDSSNIEFLPGGRRAVLGNDHEDILIFDVISRRVVRTFEGSWYDSTNFAVSPDGTTIAHAGANGVVSLLDIESWEVTVDLEAGDWVYDLTYSDDGRYLAAGTRGAGTSVFDLETHEQLVALPRDSISLAFFSDAERLLIGPNAYSEESVKVWDWRAEEIDSALDAGAPAAYETVMSPDGGRLYIAGVDSVVYAWDTQTMRLAGALPAYEPGVDAGDSYGNNDTNARGIAVSPDGDELVAGGRDGKIRFFDARTLERLEPTIDTESAVTDVRYAPDGNILVAGLWNETAVVYDREERTELSTVEPEYPIRSVLFVPDSDSLITMSAHQDDDVLRISATTGEVETTYGSHRLASSHAHLVLSDDGAYLLGIWTPAAKLYDTKSGDLIAEMPAGANRSNFHAQAFGFRTASFGPDGLSIYVGYGTGVIREVDLLTNRVRRSFSAHPRQVTSIRFSPDGKIMYTTSADGTLRTWRTETAELLTTSLATADGSWVTWTPEGYFAGTEEGIDRFVYVVDGLETYDLERLFNTFYRPDLVARKAAGGTIDGVATLADGVAEPPEVIVEAEHFDGEFRGLSAVADESAGAYIVDGRLRVRVTATEAGGGIGEIRLFHNGGRVPTAAREPTPSEEGSTASQIFAVRLVNGENRITAVALAEDRTESAPVTLIVPFAAPDARPPALWLFAVGVNEYENSRYNLNYAVDDAQSFADAMAGYAEGFFSSVEMVLLTDAAASREAVYSRFREIEERAAPQDVFVFFYAGHGIATAGGGAADTEFYFVLPDVTQMTDSDQLARHAISGEEFVDLVGMVPPRKQLLILDACNSGAVAEAFGIRGAAEEFALSRLTRATGSALIAASRDDQYAQEFPALGQGALTHVLLQGLAGDAATAGEITVSSLKRHVEYSLPLVTAEHAARAQYPTGFLFGQDFPLVVRE